MKNVKFSKSYNQIIKIKKNFYINNIENLKNALKINRKYLLQPKRIKCKNCSAKKLKKFINNFQIDYLICDKCGHLNGRYQDTKSFSRWLYEKDDGENYSKGYEKDYLSRVRNIYLPKAKFLKETVPDLNVLEIGSGACHLLKAFEDIKVKAKGYEPSKSLTKIGVKYLNKNKVYNCNLKETKQAILDEKKCNVLTMIAVLEHLNDPSIFLNNFVRSKLEYLYISVPLLSLSVFLENSFKNVFPRHLSGGHTHLYTEKSLKYLSRKFNLKIIGEWWFGTDMADLFRSILVSSKNYDKNIYEKNINNYFFKVLDKMQHVLDKEKICSEVHMIFKKN